MRSGLRLLDLVEADAASTESANIVLSCDADVIFRRRDTLSELAKVFVEEGAALAGEIRKHFYPYPEAQASFIAVRRDCYSRKDIAPWVNHGAPAHSIQRSIWRAELPVLNFRAIMADTSFIAGARVSLPRTFFPIHLTPPFIIMPLTIWVCPKGPGFGRLSKRAGTIFCYLKPKSG